MSAGGFRLVPLDCPTCGAAVAAEGDDVVYYCTACRNGYRFDGEKRALEPIEVSFVAAPDRVVEGYRPFWVLPATIRIHDRQASGGSFRGLLGRFFGGAEDRRPGEGTFVVPAFDLSLEAALELTRRYSHRLPELDERLGERLTGGRYGAADARKIAHFALLASEVDKPDTLSDLRYEIEFGAGRLLGVPFVRRGEGWADALFGVAA
jgi:hypothetical protein